MYQRVPLHLQGRVRDFHEYLLECGHTRATDEHLRSLPQSLRENLNLSLRRHLIEAVPLFRALTTFELMELLHAVDTRITVPGEVVVRAGTSGDEMYFVARGQVDILDGDRSARIATLGVGARVAARNSTAGFGRRRRTFERSSSVDVDAAHVWTNRARSSRSRSRAEELASKLSHMRTLKSG